MHSCRYHQGCRFVGLSHTLGLYPRIKASPLKSGSRVGGHDYAVGGDALQEPDAFVRAILGHFFFVYIHPYMDGNGRTARFTMNSQLVTGGYNWVVVPVEQRDRYMQVLERASVDEEIEDFVRFIVSLM